MAVHTLSYIEEARRDAISELVSDRIRQLESFALNRTKSK